MDAISFVLGIQSSQLRSNNLKELIYHSGLVAPTSAKVQEIVHDEENKPFAHNAVQGKTSNSKKGSTQHPLSNIGKRRSSSISSSSLPDTASVSAHYESSEGDKYVFTRR
jgi:hypothetical protein